MAMAPLRHHCKTAGPCLGSRLKTGHPAPTAVLAVGSGEMSGVYASIVARCRFEYRALSGVIGMMG